MTSKHSAGPWILSHNTNWKTNPFSVCVKKYGVHSTTIANIPTRMTIPPEEQQANARLIGAAPDLLAALRWALDQIEDDLDPDHQAALTAARTAIAKATGA